MILNKMISWNKKAQYMMQPQRQPYENIHPVLIVGIVLVILKFLLPSFGITANAGWLFWVGVFTILIGGMLSIMKSIS